MGILQSYTIAHTECSTSWGGQEIRVLSEMSVMRARGHRLLLCAPLKSRIYEECLKAGFEVHPLDARKLSYPATIVRLAQLFGRKQVQAVNPHSSRDDWLAGIANLIRKAGLEKKISLLGYRDDVPNVLASLTVLALPSTGHEGIPQVVLQAQAMARGVVGSAVGGIPEVVRDGETGLLVPPRDAAALADGINRLLDDPTLRERLGRQARELIVKEHSLPRMCERLEELYARHLP